MSENGTGDVSEFDAGHDHQSGKGSPGDWDELLSAYWDGEVTPEERKLVEERLAHDAVAGETLAAFRQMTAELAGLAPSVPPSNLAATTLQRIAELRPVIVPASSPPARRWRREFWQTVVACGLTACCVGLMWRADRMTGVGERGPGAAMFDFDVATAMPYQPPGEGSATVTMLSEATAEKQQMRRAGGVGSDFFGLEMRGEKAESQMMLSSTSNEPAAPLAAKAPAAPPMAAMPLAKDAAASLGDAISSNDQLPALGVIESAGGKTDSQLEPWAEVQPYLSLVTQDHATVANVELVVVDVKRAADQFEVLLMENGVARVPESSARDSSRETADKLKSAVETPEESSGLVAVYVDSAGDPVTQALAELARRRELLAIRLQPPLVVEAGDEGEVAQANRSGGVVRRVIPEGELATAYWNQQQPLDNKPSAEGDSPASSGGKSPLSDQRRAADRAEGRAMRLGSQNEKLQSSERKGTASSNAQAEVADSLELARGNISQRVHLEPTMRAAPGARYRMETENLQRGISTAVRPFDTPAESKALANGMVAERALARQLPLASASPVRVLFVLQPSSRIAPR